MERTKENIWLEAELYRFLKDLAATEDRLASLNAIHARFVGSRAPAALGGFDSAWGRYWTYSDKRKKAMIRAMLKRLIDHGRVVTKTVKIGADSKWWEKRGPKRTVVYCVVGLLDALAHAAKGPAQLVQVS